MLAKLIATTALTVLAGTTAIAANADRPHRARHARAAQQETPPPAEAARLMAFRGVWNFDGTVTMANNKPRKARWRMGCASTAGGWALACDDTIPHPAHAGHPRARPVRVLPVASFISIWRTTRAKSAS